MKKLIYLCWVLVIFAKVQAQNVNNNSKNESLISGQDTLLMPPNIIAIASAGGKGNDYGNGIVLDNNGNIYITGNYKDTALFEARVISEHGNSNIFVAKYNSSGVLAWVKSIAGKDIDAGRSIAVDDSGNVYITGGYSGTARFGSVTKTAQGNNDIFVAKYNTNGGLQWVASAGGTGYDRGLGIALDRAGNVYVTGYYSSTATFESISKTAEGSMDVFVARYYNDGHLAWVVSAGGTGDDLGYSIAVDGSSHVYITGYYYQKATFGQITKTVQGFTDMFVAKYNGSGVLQWVETAGGKADDYGQSIAVDKNGNAYVTGYYNTTITFGANYKTFQGEKGIYAIYVAKYNSNGGIEWVHSAGGKGGVFGQGLVVDSSGNVYVTGSYFNEALFGSTLKIAKGEDDIFVAKYNSSGTLQWVASAGGTYSESGINITLDRTGRIYVVGHYYRTASFGSTDRTSQGDSDIFIIRLDQ